MSDEHAVARINDGWYVCECGQSGAERWAILHQFPNQRVRPVSDDISDTIAAELRDWWGYRHELHRGRVAYPRWVEVSTGILAALRGAGYEIVTTEEAKLISLENQPPDEDAGQ